MDHIAPTQPPAGEAVAVVTGASRGLGRAIAHRLAADGFVLGVHYGRDRQAATDTVSGIEAAGGRAFAFAADLSAPTAGEDLWEAFDAAASSAGCTGLPVHTLVNNAGITARGTIEDLERRDYLAQQAINVNAPYFIVKHAMPRLRDGGRIINISSVVTRRAHPEVIAYAMTKGAIEAFTLALAKHLGSRGITVNAVAPGVLDTDMNADWLRGHPGSTTQAAQGTALGRLGEPEDVADVVAFLASEQGRWITGQLLDATGGTDL